MLWARQAKKRKVKNSAVLPDKLSTGYLRIGASGGLDKLRREVKNSAAVFVDWLPTYWCIQVKNSAAVFVDWLPTYRCIQIVGISTALAPEKQQFVAIDIFSGKKFKTTFPLSGTCFIVGISTALAPEKQHFVAIDIFSGKKFKATFPLSGTCFVPIVTYTDYHLVDIDDDSYVTLIDDKGNMKYDLMLPTDKALVSQITVGIRERKDVFVSLVSAMGKEQIIASYALNRK